MKILGLEITRRREPVADQITVRPVTPGKTTPVAKIPNIKPIVLKYAQSISRGRGNFNGGEYDLAEIGKIEDTDSFVRQSFTKKHGLMFKEGFTVEGPNKDTVQYIKIRLAQIARASSIPTTLLLKRIAKSLIRTSNAFLVKVRNAKASGGQVRKQIGGKTLQPVAGYFPAAPETMRFEMDADTGEIVKWRQLLPDGKYKEFNPSDVIHFAINQREGFVFGIPDLVPVIDDIRALRQLEENIELLLYQNLFPLFHYTVGTEDAPAGITEDGVREIEVVEDIIRTLPSEGFIITPERHEIEAIGSEGRAIRAEGYLTHFKKRVFAGLGVSQIDMGDGDTTNRATANTLSRALVDSVKDLQDAFEAMFDQYIISELLLESTFGDQVLDDNFMVHLRFHEIDVQNKIEQEAHSTKLWESNGLTYDEYRNALGREPIKLPETADDQDPAKYPEWFQTYWKLIEEPTNLIRAVDEPYSMAAQAAAESRSLSVTSKQAQTAQQAKEKEQTAQAESDRQTKIAIAKARPIPQKDNFIRSSFRLFEQDTVARVKANVSSKGHIDDVSLLAMGRIWANDVANKLTSLAIAELLKGFNAQTGYRVPNANDYVAFGRKILFDRTHQYLDNLIVHTIKVIKHRVDASLGDVKLSEALDELVRELRVAFDAVRFRTDVIWDVELGKAYNYGRLLGMQAIGNMSFKLVAADGACDACKAMNGRIVRAETATIEDVPPLHPHSKMEMEIIPVKDSMAPAREEGKPAVKQENEGISKITGICPECGNTATLQKMSGKYYCKKCEKAFDPDEIEDPDDEDEDVDDGAKFERCVMHVKQQLIKKYPGMSTKERKSRAYAICTASQKKGGW